MGSSEDWRRRSVAPSRTGCGRAPGSQRPARPAAPAVQRRIATSGRTPPSHRNPTWRSLPATAPAGSPTSTAPPSLRVTSTCRAPAAARLLGSRDARPRPSRGGPPRGCSRVPAVRAIPAARASPQPLQSPQSDLVDSAHEAEPSLSATLGAGGAESIATADPSPIPSAAPFSVSAPVPVPAPERAQVPLPVAVQRTADPAISGPRSTTVARQVGGTTTPVTLRPETPSGAAPPAGPLDELVVARPEAEPAVQRLDRQSAAEVQVERAASAPQPAPEASTPKAAAPEAVAPDPSTPETLAPKPPTTDAMTTGLLASGPPLVSTAGATRPRACRRHRWAATRTPLTVASGPHRSSVTGPTLQRRFADPGPAPQVTSTPAPTHPASWSASATGAPGSGPTGTGGSTPGLDDQGYPPLIARSVQRTAAEGGPVGSPLDPAPRTHPEAVPTAYDAPLSGFSAAISALQHPGQGTPPDGEAGSPETGPTSSRDPQLVVARRVAPDELGQLPTADVRLQRAVSASPALVPPPALTQRSLIAGRAPLASLPDAPRSGAAVRTTPAVQRLRYEDVAGPSDSPTFDRSLVADDPASVGGGVGAQARHCSRLPPPPPGLRFPRRTRDLPGRRASHLRGPSARGLRPGSPRLPCSGPRSARSGGWTPRRTRVSPSRCPRWSCRRRRGPTRPRWSSDTSKRRHRAPLSPRRWPPNRPRWPSRAER